MNSVGVSTSSTVEKSLQDKQQYSSPEDCGTIVGKDVVDKAVPSNNENMNQGSDVDNGYPSARDDFECSYEEIVVEDEEEYLEYYEEILDESEFTEETLDDEDACVTSSEQQENLDKYPTEQSEPMESGNRREFLRNGAGRRSSQSLLNGSSHSQDANIPGRRSSTMGRRPVIKSATEKALEEEKARIALETAQLSRDHEYKLARKNSFCLKDEERMRMLQEEEEQHIREDEEREQKRLEEEEKLAQKRAEEAAALIQAQHEKEERERLQKLEEERLEQEAEERRLEALKIAQEKEEAEKARKEKEEAQRIEREKKRMEIEEELRKLELELAEKKRLAAEAEEKRIAEQSRLQAKVQARRIAKKEESIRNLGVIETKPADVVTNADPSSAPPQAASVTYYSVEDLRKMKIPGLDYKNREIYLSPDDFKAIFGMTREEFDKEPKWKKTTLKRKAKLF